MAHTRHIQKRISQRGITTGLVVVECGEALITTYALDSYSRKKARGQSELH